MSTLIVSLLIYGVLGVMTVTSVVMSGVSLSRSSNGVDGATGTRGPTGASSTITGPAGSIGPTGSTGTSSTTTGPTGYQGNTGATGPTGASSTVTGPTGSHGNTGATGPSGPSFPVTDAVFEVVGVSDNTRNLTVHLTSPGQTQLEFSSNPTKSQIIVFPAPTGTVATVVYDQSVSQQVYRLTPINYPPGSNGTISFVTGQVGLGLVNLPTNTDMAGVISGQMVAGVATYDMNCTFTPAMIAPMPHAVVVSPMQPTLFNSWYVHNLSTTGFTLTATSNGTVINTDTNFFTYIIL